VTDLVVVYALVSTVFKATLQPADGCASLSPGASQNAGLTLVSRAELSPLVMDTSWLVEEKKEPRASRLLPASVGL